MKKDIPTIFADRLFRYITIVVLFISLLKRLQGLTVLTISILAFIYGAKIWSKVSKNKIILHYNMENNRLFPGENVPVTVTVENRKLLPVWLKLIFQSSRFKFLKSDIVKESSLFWYQQVEWDLKLTADKRGYYLLNPPSIVVGDPFGLFKENIEITVEPVELIVYPEIYSIKMIDLPQKMFMGDITERYGMIKDPVFIAGIREYQNGQSARYIDWKASARYQTLQEKTFESSTELKVLFIIDVNGFDEDEIRFEKMIEVVASMAVQLEQEGFSFGLITNGSLAGKTEEDKSSDGFLSVKRDERHLSTLLELLARLKQKSGNDMLDLLTDISFSGLTILHFTYTSGESDVDQFLREKGLPLINITCESTADTSSDINSNINYDTDYNTDCSADFEMNDETDSDINSYTEDSYDTNIDYDNNFVTNKETGYSYHLEDFLPSAILSDLLQREKQEQEKDELENGQMEVEQ